MSPRRPTRTTVTAPPVSLDRMTPQRRGLLRAMATTAPGDARSAQLGREYEVQFGRYSMRRRPSGQWVEVWHAPDIRAEFAAYVAAHPDEVHPDWQKK